MGGYAAGLIAADYLPALTLPLTLAGCACLAVATLWSRPARIRAVLLAAALSCAGAAHYRLQVTPPHNPQHIHWLADGEPYRIDGTVLQWTRYADGGARALIDTSAAGQSQLQPTYGRIRLSIQNDSTPAAPGDRIRLETKLRPPRLFNTPGEFDSPRHLARLGVFATGFAPDSNRIVRFATERAVSPGLALGTLRHQMAAHIDSHFPTAQSALLRALALGDRSGMQAKQRDLLGKSGLAHLFAISGLHLGLVAGLLFLVASGLYRRSTRLICLCPPRRILPLLLLPVLAGYLLFTGSALSTWRALLLLVLAAIGPLLRRRFTGGQALTVVGGLLLFFDPLSLFEASFQLSFAGAAGIVAIWPRWQPIAEKLPRPLSAPLAIVVCSGGATLATLPLVLFHFHLLAPAGMLLNTLAIPVVSLVAVPAILLGCLLLPLWPAATTALFSLAAHTLEGLLALASATLELPGLAGYAFFPTQSMTLLLAGLAATLLFPAWSWRKRAVSSGAVIVMFAGAFFLQPAGNLRVAAISVGQGDATLLQTASGTTCLVDAGGFFSSRFDTGERLVAPALGRMGIHHLDAVMLTHLHPDHSGGLAYILEHIPTGGFYSPYPPQKLPDNLRSVLTRRNIPVHTVPAGWSSPDELSPLSLFTPPRATGNDTSMVVYVRRGQDGVLLTGDLEQQGIAALASSPPPGPANLLKIPHHGSRSSLPGPLLSTITPQQAFISVGYSNRFGQPHPEVCAQLARHDIPFRRTDIDGTLLYTSNGSGWTVEHWSDGLFR